MPLHLANSGLETARQEKSSTGHISVESCPFAFNLTLRKCSKCYSNLIKISIYFERCPLPMVSNEINPYSHIHCSRLKCPWQDACEVFELWGLPSEEWEKQYSFSTWSAVRFDISLLSQEAPKTLEDWLCLQIWGGREGPFGDRLHLSAKKPVSAKPQILEIQVLLIQLCMLVPSSGSGVSIRVLGRKNRRWQTPCMPWRKQAHGFLLDSRKGKTRGDRSSMAFARNTAYQSHLLPSCVGAT